MWADFGRCECEWRRDPLSPRSDDMDVKSCAVKGFFPLDCASQFSELVETGRLLERRWGGDTLPLSFARGVVAAAAEDEVPGGDCEAKATP